MTLTWLWPALFVAALPVFVAGLLEDITKDIGASKRLLAAFLSAAIAWWLLGGVSRVGMAPVDYVLAFWPVALLFTMIAPGGDASGRRADLPDLRRLGVGDLGLPGLELPVRARVPGRRRGLLPRLHAGRTGGVAGRA
ncbi:hypothetical protein G6F50_016003 [Rhizopus delemar]|uniref:Uncharacterized protein n=1 Tax=Rhizopus delemar TaxID=936053 RepID=A0A9P6XUV5_9FUNG|nr:hypothetical protein G6F50_016003 [Rhizopus delemar]